MAWETKREIVKRYDASADMYEGLYGEEQEGKYRLALEKVDVAGAAVLDVGCGSGLFFEWVADKAELVVGVDVSRNLLCKAKEKARKFGNCFVLQGGFRVYGVAEYA
jgi:cyclopropane fatty-acyl-phospholipid synthase-like methyltransferase